MDQIRRFANAMPEQVDAVLIRSAPNRLYFTGLRSMGGKLFFTRKEAFFLIDSRYIEIARRQVAHCTVLLEEDISAQLRELIANLGIKTVGTETGYLSARELHRLEEMIAPAKLSWSDEVDEAILRQRRIKTAEEIESLALAQRITDEAFASSLGKFRPGAWDLDVAAHIGLRMARGGSEQRSFDFIFTSGPNTSLPHGSRENRRMQVGDFVMMDMGSMVKGYGSDMTRTVSIGKVSPQQREVYEIVLEAQLRALDKIRPGARCRDVDAAARDYIRSKGYGDCFGHGLGHSLGVEIHENPRFNQVSGDVLEEGVVMTVEPGIYLPGKFGVRIEDMVVVTKNGCRNLTESPKELLELGN